MEQPQHPGVQLPLEVQLRDDATLENFTALPGLAPVLDVLAASPAVDREPVLYLFGPTGSGKTHLLQAGCHGAGVGSVYLPLTELQQYDPESVLAGMQELQRICLDDVQSVAGQPGWEDALFHLANRARQSGCQLVIAADRAPRQLPLTLADLQSRLSGGLVFRLPLADDEQLVSMLQHRAARRGMQLAPEVANYIVSRAPRDPEWLMSFLDQLDRESLSHQRVLSIPFVRSLLRA